ncbi:hypothetical protein Tco_0640088 [Tanacetum coccineum]
MSLWKRACFTTPTGRFEVGESSSAAAARQPGLDVATVDATPGCPMSREVGYGIEDVWDDMVGDMEKRAPTLEDLCQRVTGLAVDLARDTHEMHVHFEDARDDRAFLRTRVNTLFRGRAVHAELLACRAKVKALREQVSLLQRQRISDEDRLTRHVQHDHDRFVELVRTTRVPEPTRDPEPRDGPTDAGSSSQGVADALAEIEANRTSRNGDDSHNSGTGSRRTEMFPEESDEVEKYVGGLTDMIQGSVMASKPKKMQDAIEFATELID